MSTIDLTMAATNTELRYVNPSHIKAMTEVLAVRQIVLVEIAKGAFNLPLPAMRTEVHDDHHHFPTAFKLQEEVAAHLMDITPGERDAAKKVISKWTTAEMDMYILAARKFLGLPISVETAAANAPNIDIFAQKAIRNCLNNLQAIKEHFPDTFKVVWKDVSALVRDLSDHTTPHAGATGSYESTIPAKRHAAQSELQSLQSWKKSRVNDTDKFVSTPVGWNKPTNAGDKGGHSDGKSAKLGSCTAAYKDNTINLIDDEDVGSVQTFGNTKATSSVASASLGSAVDPRKVPNMPFSTAPLTPKNHASSQLSQTPASPKNRLVSQLRDAPLGVSSNGSATTPYPGSVNPSNRVYPQPFPKAAKWSANSPSSYTR